jgi:uncharacterized protein
MVMLKRIAAPLALVVTLACAGPVLAADPTVEQVYQAARAGHLDEAQQLMDQVLKDHPTSAKAHYVEAELSAKAGNLARGRTELAEAQRLDPSGAFAKPEALAALQRELAGRGTSRGPTGYYPSAPPARAEERRSSFPWPIILLVVAGVVIAWALLSRRNRPQYPQYPGSVPPPGGVPGGGYGGGPAGYGPAGYGPPAGGGMGSGIVGGLASGLAIGAGVAAGEELVHHFTDRDGNRVEAPPGYVPPPPDENSNMGGNDFGTTGGDSWDDNSGGGGGGDFGGDSGGGGGGGDWT